MKKRQYGKDRELPASELNSLANYQEDNVQLFAQDTGFAGCYLTGGDVEADSPVSWNVVLKAITKARDQYGDRLYISSDQDIDMEPSGDPGAGNEVYMSAFLEYTPTTSEADTDGGGTPYFKDYDDGYTISVVEGTVATLGNAVKPAIPAGKLSVCDVLVTDAVYTRGTILDADIDISRQASFVWPDELGKTTITDTTESTTKDTGALIVEGGVGVEKRINAGGKICTADTTDSSSKDTGSIITEGGIGAEKAIFAGGKISTANQLESTVATGTAPLAVTSTTKVANLNVEQVDGCDVETTLTAGTDKVPRSDAVTAALNEYQAMINYIINGGMDTWQRGTSFTAATTPANNDDTYLPDRWILLSDGNDIVDVSRSTDCPDGFQYSTKFLVATANKKFGIVQPIESALAKRLTGKTVSFSVQAKTTGGAVVENIRMALLSWSSTADVVTSDVVAAWGNEGDNPTWAANWTAENTAANKAITTSWAEYKVEGVVVDTASMANLALVIWVDDTDCAQNDELYLTGIMLNDGATVHEFVPFGGTSFSDHIACLKRCYLIQPISSGNYTPMGSGRWSSDTSGWISITFPVEMAKEPTLIQIGADTDFFINTGGGLVGSDNITDIAIAQSSLTECCIAVTCGASLGVAGDGTTLYEENNSGATLGFDSEL